MDRVTATGWLDHRATLRDFQASSRALRPALTLDLASRLREIRVPTLVAWGADDRLMPRAHGVEMATALGARFVVIPDARTLIPLDNPGAFVDACRAWFSANPIENQLTKELS